VGAGASAAVLLSGSASGGIGFGVDLSVDSWDVTDNQERMVAMGPPPRSFEKST
jgi:hypothetical protein